MNHRLPYSTKRHLLKREHMIYWLRARRVFYLRTRKQRWSFLERNLADLLTLSRLFLGMYLLWSGLVDGRAVLAQDVWILVLAWSTDIIDGRISRTLSPGHQGWIGRNDVYVDMFFSVSVLVFMMITGLLPLVFGLVYMLVWAAMMIRWGIPPVFAQLFQNPIYAVFLFFTFAAAPQVFLWLLLWALVAGVFFGGRMMVLFKGALARFQAGFRRMKKE